MVSEILMNLTSEAGLMYNLPPVLSLYFFAFLFSCIIGIIVAVSTGRVYAGLGGFLGMLLLFSLLDAFPLWIVAVPLVVLLVLGRHTHGGGT